MRLASAAPPPFTGSTEDAFFALVTTPPPPAAAASQAVPAVVPVSGTGTVASLSFLGTSVSWASLTSTVSTLPQSSVASPALTRSEIWSLDPASVNRLLAASNQADQPLVPASAKLLTSTVPDDGSVDALGDNPLFGQLVLDLTRD
jgi:hypothetical protein